MSVQEGLEIFLLENSNINKKFIIDFFGIQKKKLYKDHEPFIIDLDDVVYWLDAVKGNMKATLVESYNNISDYKIINALLPRQKRLPQGGQNKEIILLTPDCFKMLCLRSKTDKAEQVRKYYVDLEKLIDKYKVTKKIQVCILLSLLECSIKRNYSGLLCIPASVNRHCCSCNGLCRITC